MAFPLGRLGTGDRLKVLSHAIGVTEGERKPAVVEKHLTAGEERGISYDLFLVSCF